ncbi:hypothetical protein [Pseudoclavibacter soli]|uniref:hypothetical protein n=1 Tax=Pseudoclavibacter soli TaxID=452623 RepID=UPI000484DC20|nr:hypothetical protein [Pseudoclavibacter soli]
MATRIERKVARLPAEFDMAAHSDRLGQWVKHSSVFGPDWELQSISVEEHTVTAIRQAAVSEVSESTVRSRPMKVIGLPRGTKPAEADKYAASYADTYPGFQMTRFDPYLLQATVTKMAPEEVRCRDAIANALGCKPWDVQVFAKSSGGFDIELPPTYTPSKHDDKLDEVATTVVGRPGWFVRTQPAKLTAQIIPAELPAFDKAYPYPDLGHLRPKSLEDSLQLPLGMRLGGPGEPNTRLDFDFDATPGALVSGTAGSGKSVTVNALIFGALQRGWELVVVDVPHKAIDYEWVKPYVRENGFGCASKASSLTALKLVYAEGERRAALLAEHGVQKWQELPAPVRAENPLILVIMDEVTGLFASDPIPKALPKDHPERVEAEQHAMETDLLKMVTAKIPAELRFVGIRIILATQMAQANTGISVPLKTNLANRVLQGAKPSKAARGHALNDPDAAPHIPEWISADKGQSRGVGVAELEGQVPCVFKSFFASTDTYLKALSALGVQRNHTPEPTAAQIDRYVPRLDDGLDEDGEPAATLPEPTKRFGAKQSAPEEWELDPETGKPLTGFARANAARHALGG